MTDLQKLLQKQARLQQQIEAAKKASRRKIQVGLLAEKARALDLPDAKILEALRAAVAAAQGPQGPAAEGGDE